jgi:hypothetical protein
MTPAIRGGKGEFLIATFNDATLLKIWTVKEKHIKKLGLYSGLVRKEHEETRPSPSQR